MRVFALSWPFILQTKRVTDGARTRDLRSHNPSEHIRVRADRSQYVAKVSEKVTVRSAGGPLVSG